MLELKGWERIRVGVFQVLVYARGKKEYNKNKNILLKNKLLFQNVRKSKKYMFFQYPHFFGTLRNNFSTF